MPGLIFAFSPLTISALVLWTVAASLIMFDFHRMRQERQRGESTAWYQRPMLWFAACGFPFGGMLASASLNNLFPYRLEVVIILGFFLLLLPLFAGGLIAVLRLEAKQNALDEETRLRQLAATSPTPVAQSRLIENQAIPVMITLAILLSVLALLNLVLFYTHRTLDQFLLREWMILLTVLLTMFAGLIVRLRVQKRFIKRINQRRVALAAESKHSQRSAPISSEPMQPLLPPLVLRLKWLAIICYLTLVGAYILYWLSLTNATNNTGTILNLLFYPWLLLFFLLRGLRERVETTTHGLTVVRGAWFARQKQQIPWQEARLFACYKIRGFFGGKATMIYELSSPGRVVQWTRVINPSSLFTPWKTGMPNDEYNRQTQQLCTCIAAQTGLQLHDLSEERSNMLEQEMTMVQSYERN